MPSANPYRAQLAAIPVSEHSVSILGSLTKYWIYGPDDAPQTLVLVHGFRGEHHGLEPVVAQLSGIRIISPDLPAFGDSTVMTEAAHDVPGYVAWLDAFIDSLALSERPAILGHSFGSIVTAAAVAGGLDTPRLILVNPIAAPALAGPKAALTGLAVFYYWLGAKLPKRLGYSLLGNALVVRFVTVSMAKTKSRSLKAWIHDQHLTYFSRFADRDTVLEAFKASTSNNVIQFAPDITVPTLLIAAAEDQITKVADERRLLELLPDGRLHIIDGVGHLIHYETPREAAEQIVEFLGAGSLSTVQSDVSA